MTNYDIQIYAALTIILSLGLSALISSAETALTGVSRGRLSAMMSNDHAGASRVWRLLETPKKFISTLLLMNNFVNIVSSSVITLIFIKLFGDKGALYSTLTMTILVVIFGEIIPKSIAIARPTESSIKLAPFVSFLVFITTPFVIVLQFLVDLIFKMIGFQSKGIIDEDVVREELRGSIDVSHQSGAVFKDEKDRLGGLLDLRDLDVSEVMMHRKDITMMDVETSAHTLISEVLKTPYTRVPLYQDNIENIVGVLHAKDALRALIETKSGFDDINIFEIMRKPWFIPETTPVTVQLNKFLSHRNHFALVVDEYGGLRGLITLEDILEEIVGEIRDEHDVEIPGLRRHPDGAYIVNGKISVRDLNRKTGWRLPDDDYTTIAGLIIHESKTIPEKGQSFLFFGTRFEILERERNQITKIRASIVPKEIA
ncbi:MAG: Mg2+/Co2+ transporter CorB [Alphaproteobacteria bacterium]|jgi:Mg2+/Co2+ transporter CorB